MSDNIIAENVGKHGAHVPTDEDELEGQFGGVLDTLSIFRTQITGLQQQIRGIERTVRRKMKQADKERKNRRNKGQKKPSGFALPTNISNELCEFMSKEKGTMVARTDVTRFIIDYIKQKDLQNPENRKFINPDLALKKLLEVDDQDKLSYFNLQKYMNRHFHKIKKEGEEGKDEDGEVDKDEKGEVDKDEDGEVAKDEDGEVAKAEGGEVGNENKN